MDDFYEDWFQNEMHKEKTIRRSQKKRKQRENRDNDLSWIIPYLEQSQASEPCPDDASDMSVDQRLEKAEPVEDIWFDIESLKNKNE